MRWIVVVLGVLAACQSVLAHAQESVPDRINQYIDAFAHAGPLNGVVLVGKDGRILAVHAAGKASFAYDVPNERQTRFEVASITKTFTAQLVMRLVDENRIQLSDSIQKHLPDFPAAWGPQVTVEQLLCHTGGVQGDIADFPPVGNDFPPIVAQINADFFSLAEMLPMIAARSLLFPPGQEYSYSSDGYAILGAIAGAATGTSYEEALTRHVLDPCQLDCTGYVPQTVIVPGLATGYQRNWGGYENARRIGISPGGGLYSSADDLFRWTEATRRGLVMSAATKDRAWRLSPNITQFGWKRRVDAGSPQPGTLLVQCSGALPGANSLVTMTLSDGITVIVLTNTREMSFRLDELTTAIIAMLRGGDVPAVKRSAAQELYATIDSQGGAASMEEWPARDDLERNGFYVSESEVNSLGYHFLTKGLNDCAVAVLRLNAGYFPESANAHDSLGEALAALGDHNQAIAHYQRSLELNPENANARAMLEKLR